MKKVTILALALVLLATGCSIKNKNQAKELNIEEAKVAALDFINGNLVQKGSNVSIKEIVDENGLYRIKVVLANGQEVDSFLTKDGKKFFPQVMDVDQTIKDTAARDSQANNETKTKEEAKNAPKSDKPTVDLFVMSYCPYGTQIEKGAIPMAEALGNKINFQIKYVDYVMHGEKEVDENLRQYCIQKEQSKNYFPYLKCFLKAGDSPSCLKEAKINEKNLAACVSSTDKKFAIKEKFADKTKWPTGNFPPFDIYKDENVKYDVKGSPTLVINGAQISAGRDPQSMLEAVCSSFNKQPNECTKKLASESPSAGFGEGTGGTSGGGCATN